jgi:hypothetical protein
MTRPLTCLLVLFGTISIVLSGCGESKTAPAVAPVPTAEGQAAAPAAKDAPAPAGYTVPSALSAKEVKAQYGTKQMRKAKKSNTAGYKARKAEDAAKAIEHYEKALELAPGYVTARFNLACEHARAKDADSAIAEVEHLFRMGTAEALLKAAKLQVDSDFDPIREDPRIKAIGEHFAFDVDKGAFTQMCANRGKMIDAMGKDGFYETYAQGDGYPIAAASKKRTGGKARTALNKILDFTCEKGKIRKDEMGGNLVLSDTKLSKWTEKYPKRCVNFSGIVMPDNPDEGTSSTEGLVCFIRQGEDWIIGVAGMYDLGHGGESDTGPGEQKAVKKAIKEWGS